MPIDADSLETLVERQRSRLLALSNDQASAPTRAGEWSSKQVVGHLVDSALNTYRHIICALIAGDTETESPTFTDDYDQDDWMEHGGYKDRPWPELVNLWYAVNSQLIFSVRRFSTVSGSAAKGSGPDYVEHLQSHLARLPEVEPVLRVLPDRIQADGLILRLALPTDAPALIAAVQDPEIPKWTTVPSPYGQHEAEEFIDRSSRWQRFGDLRKNYLVFEGETLLAMVGLVRVRADDLVGEVGYWCAAEARGRRVTSRALNALLKEVLAAGYKRIEAEVLVGNIGSERVLLSAGFTKEGRFRSIGSQGCGVNETRIDLDVFSLLPNRELSQRKLTSNSADASRTDGRT